MCVCGWHVVRLQDYFIDLLDQSKSECLLPSEDFSEEDLIGTWVAGWADRNDTLIIQKDGTYKQVIHIAYLEIDYESDWQSWRIEYPNNGPPYLHLEGMRLCAAEPESISCDNSGDPGPWYDFCHDKSIQMNNEGILIILGIPEEWINSSNDLSTNHGINLWLPLGYENTWTYILQAP